MNKIIEYFNSLSDQLRYAILVLVFFLVILLDVVLLVLPQMDSIANINDQIKKLSEDTRQVLQDRGRTNLLRKNLQEDRDQLKSLSVKVRPIQEVPLILSAISSIANEYGVKIDQLVPEKNLQETLKAASESKFYSLPIVIKAHCGYHMFGHFLNKLENENMFFILDDFIIQNDEKDPKEHLFSLTINIILVDQSSGQAKNL